MVRRAQPAAPQVFAFRLDLQSGVPVYRQLMDQVQAALATGSLKAGDQLPTVRQVAVDLAINPNTVTRAYKEMEIRSILTTQQGTGTFIGEDPVSRDEGERKRRLHQLVGEMVARAGGEGYSLKELMEVLKEKGR